MDPQPSLIIIFHTLAWRFLLAIFLVRRLPLIRSKIANFTSSLAVSQLPHTPRRELGFPFLPSPNLLFLQSSPFRRMHPYPLDLRNWATSFLHFSPTQISKSSSLPATYTLVSAASHLSPAACCLVTFASHLNYCKNLLIWFFSHRRALLVCSHTASQSGPLLKIVVRPHHSRPA